VSIAGMPDATVTDTVCSPEVAAPIPSIPIDPPTIAMTFSVNDSPLGGKTGSKYAALALSPEGRRLGHSFAAFGRASAKRVGKWSHGAVHTAMFTAWSIG
jgi:hypothetical protein